MKTNYTDEQIQAAIDAAFREATSLVKLSAIYGSSAWEDEKADRLDVAKILLARLPELTPPTADGKTPGQVLHEASKEHDEKKNGVFGWKAWDKIDCQDLYEVGASAVLAAFGGDSLEQAIARMEAVPVEELDAAYGITRCSRFMEAVRARLIAAAREGQPASQPAEIPWNEWPGGECPLKDEEVAEWEFKRRNETISSPSGRPSGYRWAHYNDYDIIAYRVTKWREGFGPAAVDWKAKYEAQETTLNQVLETVASICARAEKAEAELADAHLDLDQLGFPRGNGENEFTLKGRLRTLPGFQPQLATLHPIAEAGEVPAGSVRVFASKLDGWKPKTYQITADTHFADIRLPDAKAPAVEDAKPVYVGYATDEMPTIAELKAAHTAGKVIQHLQDGVWWDFIDPSGTAYSDPPKYYRIKPADTFNAHGKTWNRHTPGDPMPCGANDEIHILCQTIEAYSPEIIQAGEDVDWRSADLNLAVIGWRYADEPTPAEPLKPWTPAVGDVVTLKSGGPKMTAVKAAPELHFWCNWFDGAERHEGCFPTATLQPA